MLIVVMGVTGAGKSTVGRLLAERLGLRFFDADDFHPPANKLKMAADIPLGDADRAPWLEHMANEAVAWEASGGAVLACSALKAKYRALLGSKVTGARFVYIDVERAELERRLQARRGQHEFIGSFARILDQQFRDLEVPDDAVVLPGSLGPAEAVELAAARLQHLGSVGA
jgi:carbohydrate kinase (thermoresistant glucokinase family)